MAFRKDGEVKVFKSNTEIGKKLANSDNTNRYTVDDMIKDVDMMVSDGLEEEDAVKVLDDMLSKD